MKTCNPLQCATTHVCTISLKKKKQKLSSIPPAQYDAFSEGTGIELRRDLGANVSYPSLGDTGINYFKVTFTVNNLEFSVFRSGNLSFACEIVVTKWLPKWCQW